VRINHLGAQLPARSRNWNEFMIGASRFIWGLSKKVLIADFCSKVADAGFGVAPQTLPMGGAWMALLAYTLQIYFDSQGIPTWRSVWRACLDSTSRRTSIIRTPP